MNNLRMYFDSGVSFFFGNLDDDEIMTTIDEMERMLIWDSFTVDIEYTGDEKDEL